MLQHDWPGNVRELRNRLEYAAIVTNGELIQPEHLRLQPPCPSVCHNQIDDKCITICFTFPRTEFSLEALTRQGMDWALDQCNQNKSSAARLLKVSRKLFY
jgi:DNA-binding NtrC family response regulator